MLATRLGETPFMGLIPCASFAIRIQIRTLFGIKVMQVGPRQTKICLRENAKQKDLYQSAHAHYKIFLR